jgi:hypothetical protein
MMDKLHFLGKNRNDIVCVLVSSEGIDEGYEVVETREMLLGGRLGVDVPESVIIQERMHIRNH